MFFDNVHYWCSYQLIISFFICSLVLSLVLLLLSQVLSPYTTNFEKSSSYECGFEPFGESNFLINIQFYIIAILFLIFDLEIIVLLPWVYSISLYSIFHFYIVQLFILILTIGFIYEWKCGALDWI